MATSSRPDAALAMLAVLAGVGAAVVLWPSLAPDSLPAPQWTAAVVSAPAWAGSVSALLPAASDRASMRRGAAGAVAAAAPATVRVAVLDLHRRPVPRLALEVTATGDASIRAMTGEDGCCEVAFDDASPTTCVAGTSGWVTIQPAYLRRGVPHTTMIVARSVPMRGVVVDSAGQVLADSILTVATAEKATGETDWHGVALSGADGTFVFPGVPVGVPLDLAAQATGMQEQRLQVARPGDWQVITLVEITSPEPLHGQVLAPDGSGIEGARLQLATALATSGRGGVFELRLPATPTGEPLLVTCPSAAPALIERWRDERMPSAPLTIQLGVPLSLRGRVVDADGRPCPGWRVELADPTPLDRTATEPRMVETLWRHDWIVTDAQGAFALPDVLDRGYLVEAWSPDGRQFARRENAQPRAWNELVAARGDQPIQGRVFDASGAPLSGVSVGPARSGYLGPAGLQAIAFDARATTAADGTFASLHGGSCRHWIVDAPGFVPTVADVRLTAAALVLRPERVRAIDFRGVQVPSELRLGVRDACGRPLWFHVEGDADWVKVADPNCRPSLRLGVCRTADHIVLLREDRALGRLPLPPSGSMVVSW